MVLMPSSENSGANAEPSLPIACSPYERRTLLEIAFASIQHGLSTGHPLSVASGDYHDTLQTPRATFVTLHLDGRLRGCIGSLEPRHPLVVDVAENAFAAAFCDPRFLSLSTTELTALECHISVLGTPVILAFDSETDLITQLRAGVDGLVLEEVGGYRGTFLPSVWDQLPDPRDFFSQLKRKAGLPEKHWSKTLRVLRYETTSFYGSFSGV
jgi:AmmeMemoRadiSam system protein A